MTSQDDDRDRNGRTAIIAALITGGAVVLAAVISLVSGVIHVSAGPTPKVTSTVTIPGPVTTITVTTSPAGNSSTGTVGSGLGGKSYNLAVDLESDGGAGIGISHGSVGYGTDGDIDYQMAADGTPEIISDNGHFSLDVNSQNASESQCQTALNSQPDGNPLTNFHKGLLFCVSGFLGGIALMEETQPPGNSGTLYFHETYWSGT